MLLSMLVMTMTNNTSVICLSSCSLNFKMSIELRVFDELQNPFFKLLIQCKAEWLGMVLTLSWTATVIGPQRSSRWRKELEPFFFKI